MNFFTENWKYFASLAGGVVTFLGGYKTREAGRDSAISNAKSDEAGALSNMQSAYDQFTEHTSANINRMQKEIDELKADNRQQRSVMSDLQKDNSSLHTEVSRLMKENNELKLRVSELKGKNNELCKRLDKKENK